MCNLRLSIKEHGGVLQGERLMTGCVYGRQVCCAFNSQGQELPSLPVCHAKGGPYLAATPLLRLAGASMAQAGAPDTAGHRTLCLPRLYGQHWPWAPLCCCSAVLRSWWGLLLRDRMISPGVTLAVLFAGADHSNWSARRSNYVAESWWGTADSCYKGTAKEDFKRKL